MPMSFYPKVGRREFIRTGFAVTAGSLLAGKGMFADAAGERERQGHWAFAADTHISEDPANEYRGFRPYNDLEIVVAQVKRAKPQGLVVAGDVARLEGKNGDYANVQKLIEPLRESIPVHICLGNHDDRDNFLKVIQELPGDRQSVKSKYVTVVETNGVRFLLLDSLLYVNRVAGLLGKDQRTWLTQYLQESDDRPTLLFFHHTLDDEDGSLLDVDRLFTIIKPCKKVKAIVFGHSHAYRLDKEDGIHLINLPATGYNFNDNEPVGWIEADVSRKGTDLTLHAIGGNSQKDGQTSSLTWRT
ncbi:MAG: metallophosphoesterase [bacterium]